VLQLIINGIVSGSVFALGAVAFSLIYRVAGFMNFAQGDYATYGAYIALAFNVDFGFGVVLATLMAMIGVALLSVLLELGAWAPLRARRSGVFALLTASFGISLLLRGLLYVIAGAGERSYHVNLLATYHIGSIRISESSLIAIGVACGGISLLSVMMVKTKLGREIRAVADDRSLADVAGIDVARITLLAWVVVGAIVALSGVLQGLIVSTFDPTMGFNLLLPTFAAVIVGGLDRTIGALVGGLALGVIMQVCTWQGFAGGVSPVWSEGIAFLILMVVMVARPRGLLTR
jgi:branched-subunit amino acid ABC-type transport system permease component